jgi:hypothetical protein
MEVMPTRPKLVAFRALSFHGDNKDTANGRDAWSFELMQEINIGLAVPTVAGGVMQGVVRIALNAKAVSPSASESKTEFSAEYEAKFDYPAALAEKELLPEFEREPHQYMLVAQVFPLAMTHFRGALQAMGFDAMSLPLGFEPHC